MTKIKYCGLFLALSSVSACVSYDPMLGQAVGVSPQSTSQEGSENTSQTAPQSARQRSPESISAPDVQPPVASQTPKVANTAVPKPTGAAAFLLEQAKQHQTQGDLGAAATKVERAMRIEPGNPWLSLALAEIRLGQTNGQQAQALAKRALARAGQDASLNRSGWQVISRAKLLLNDQAGAEDAANRAAQW